MFRRKRAFSLRTTPFFRNAAEAADAAAAAVNHLSIPNHSIRRSFRQAARPIPNHGRPTVVVGQVFYGFGVFREFSGGPGRSGMVQDKSGRLLQILIFAKFPEVSTILANFRFC